MPCEERRGSCRKFARGPRTYGKTANRAVVAADYSVFILECLPWGIILSGSEAPEKSAESVPRHALARREAMLVICRARGWQLDCKLAWPGANKSVCGGLGRLLCWIAEQLAEGRTKKKLASFRTGPIPVREPWGISPNWSEHRRWCRGGIGACACWLRSDAVRCEARGGQSHSMLALRGASRSGC